jgi:hypothetical protein
MSDDELGYPDGVYQYIHKMYFLHSLNIYAAMHYGHKKVRCWEFYSHCLHLITGDILY